MDRSDGEQGTKHQANGMRGAPRFKGAMVAGGYLGIGALLGVIGLQADAPLALRAMILLSEPVSSLVGDSPGPWLAVALGLAVNAAALGYIVHSVTRFRSRMDGMLAFADRMLGRRDG